MSLKRFAKDTAIYGIATVLPRVINILLVRLFTKNLVSKEFSDATEFWVFAAFFNVLLTYGMETSFFRFFTKLKKEKKVIDTAFTSIFITSIIALIVLMALRSPIAGFFSINLEYFTILIWVTILDTLVVIPFAYLRVTNRPIRFAAYKIFNIIIYLIFIVLLFVLLPKLHLTDYVNSLLTKFNLSPDNKAIFIFISNLIASASTLLIFLPIISKFKFRIDYTLLKQMLKYGYPVLIAGLAYVVNENLDKLMIRHMLGKQIMGSYGAIYKIGTIMTLFITAFRLGAEPFFFNQSDKKNAKQNYASIMLWFTIVGSILFVGVVAYLDFVAGLIISKEEYFAAISIVPIILFANLLLGIYHNLSIWYKLTDRTKFGMYFSVFGAVITIVFNLILIPRIGFIAAAWATVAAYGSMAVLSYLFGRKRYYVPYQVSKIVFYLTFSVVIVWIMFNLFADNTLIKTVLLIGFIAVIYLVERKEISRLRAKM